MVLWQLLGHKTARINSRWIKALHGEMQMDSEHMKRCSLSLKADDSFSTCQMGKNEYDNLKYWQGHGKTVTLKLLVSL